VEAAPPTSPEKINYAEFVKEEQMTKKIILIVSLASFLALVGGC
jgi:hypothetical protein